MKRALTREENCVNATGEVGATGVIDIRIGLVIPAMSEMCRVGQTIQ